MANSEGPIEPLYATGRANSLIFLGRAPFHITWEDNRFTCLGEAYLHLQPRLRLTLSADLSGRPTTTLRLATASGPIKLQYGQHAEPINALLVNLTSHSGPDGFTGRATFIPNPERLTLCNDRRKRLAAVTFHVMNFPAFLSQVQPISYTRRVPANQSDWGGSSSSTRVGGSSFRHFPKPST